MSRFKTVAPLLIYVQPEELDKLKKYAKSIRKPVSHIVREGIRMRLAGEQNPYNDGFDDGLRTAMDLAKKSKGGQMMFPSGKSFADLVCEEIAKFKRVESQEAVHGEND